MRREIFREYDIRGIAGKDLTDDFVELLGRGIGTLMRREGKQRITLARDCRPSSDPYRDALAAGVSASGVSVIDVGVVPTPLLYFSIFHLRSDGGVVITGRKYVRDQIRLPRKVRVAIDCGNGTGCLVAPDLIKSLGCETTELYCEMDGMFPNHHPDPTVVENLRDLQRAVAGNKLELGIAFDGDADRLGVVDDEGRIIWGDMLMILYARDILKRRPGTTFISEVKCSMNLFRDIERRGGRAIMWKTGHSLIKAKMKEENAVLAGEMSGHMFFADRYFGFDDAIYAACRLLEIVSNSSQGVAQMLSDVPPTVVTPEIRVQCDDDKKFEVVEKVRRHFKERRQVIDVDGARILFPNGWGLVRASNTQDVLVLRFEAQDQASLEAIRAEVEEQVRRAMDQS